ncbi:MAG: FixH family protein [Pararhodobacter sp.]|nr:FixH family protein [Pararhodobacter sp.]
MNEDRKPKFRMTGGKVLGIFLGAFGIIFTVNIFMAYNAVSTFPGLEVQNSYVASQGFNDRLAAQQALGWEVAVEVAEGELRVHFTDAEGNPVSVTGMTATLGRATHTRDDVAPEFSYRRGTFSAPVELEHGNWNLRLLATAPDGTEFQQRISFWHRG